jgi:hypothetical protein
MFARMPLDNRNGRRIAALAASFGFQATLPPIETT